MLTGYACLLIASTFVSEVPPLVREKLESTNEVVGTFIQTKIDGRTKQTYVTKGEYQIRPGRDFTWRTLDPFETTFYATETNYVYKNEDEEVARNLADMSNVGYFADLGKSDWTIFFKLFDALYKEEGEKFFIKAKPKAGNDLAKVLKRVEAEGTRDKWQLTATFPDETRFKLEFTDKLK